MSPVLSISSSWTTRPPRSPRVRAAAGRWVRPAGGQMWTSSGATDVTQERPGYRDGSAGSNCLHDRGW